MRASDQEHGTLCVTIMVNIRLRINSFNELVGGMGSPLRHSNGAVVRSLSFFFYSPTNFIEAIELGGVVVERSPKQSWCEV